MLNKTAYEALPYAYIGAGLINAMALESAVKYLPAVLLVFAGTLVLTWRRNARTQQRKRSADKALARHAHLTPWLG